MWALGLGMGLCTLLPSLWLRQPVMVAWSTPGAAVLATAGIAGGFGMAEATGAFIVCALLITLVGATGWFERVQGRIPMSVASALLGSIGGGLAVALKDDAHREAALITFLVTLSGLSLAGIGSAFRGVVAGAAALFVQQWRPGSTARGSQ